MNAGAAMNFRCPVDGCSRKKGEVWHLVCAVHWAKLSQEQRDRVWVLFQTEHGTLEHRKACETAIAELNARPR